MSESREQRRPRRSSLEEEGKSSDVQTKSLVQERKDPAASGSWEPACGKLISLCADGSGGVASAEKDRPGTDVEAKAWFFLGCFLGLLQRPTGSPGAQHASVSRLGFEYHLCPLLLLLLPVRCWVTHSLKSPNLAYPT